MRDSTIFYRSFYEAISELDPTTKAKVYDAIFEYSLNLKVIELEGVPKTIFTLIKPQIDANIKRYNNGKKTKKKQNGSKTEAKDKQDLSNQEANANVNNNINDNKNLNNKIEERKLKFADTLKPFIETYGRDMMLDFYKYWVEPNKSNTKFRMELEKTWSLERRLETWSKNDSSFNKPKPPQSKEIKYEE